MSLKISQLILYIKRKLLKRYAIYNSYAIYFISRISRKRSKIYALYLYISGGKDAQPVGRLSSENYNSIHRHIKSRKFCH